MIPLLLAAAVALDPAARVVFDALSEPGCPHLFLMLSPEFQKQAPADTWSAFCRSVGPLTDIERVADANGWPIYRARAPSVMWRIGLAMEGPVVTGLFAKPWQDAEPAHTLEEKLAQVSARDKLPGISVLVMQDGHVTRQVVLGVRKLGDPTSIDKLDAWHLGSDTKAMTATLAAMAVQGGQLSWSSTIGSVLTDWKDLDPRFAQVTLEQLLTHRGGLPKDIPEPIWKALWAVKDPVLGRQETVHALLKREPGKIGEFEYANAGYMAAGVMIEKVLGSPWETLIKERLFTPLGMSSCGFGAPATPGKVDAPWAHRTTGGGVEPVQPGPHSDNPPGIGPAGSVHCSLPDWAKFVEEHVRGERGEPTTLKLDAATYRKLHTAPPGGDYAMGWGVGHETWSAGPILRHNGSNTMFYASVAAAPKENVIFLVATNRAGEPARQAVAEVLTFLGATTKPVPEAAKQ